MLRLLLLITLLTVFTFPSFAQRNGNGGNDDQGRPTIEGGEEFNIFGSGYQGLTFDAGLTNIRPFRFNALYFNHAGFSQFRTFGFTSSQNQEGNDENPDGHIGDDQSMSMHWFTAQELTAIAPDSDQIRFRMKGWELMTSSFGLDFIRLKQVDLVVGVGAFWGNLKLSSENLTENSGKKMYKNPFVAPMIRGELRFNFSVITVGGRFSYRYDITRDNWKRKDDGLDPLPGYKFREMQYILFIGFRFPTYYDEDEEG